MLRFAKEYYCINDYIVILLARFDTKAFLKTIYIYLSHLLAVNFDIKDMKLFMHDFNFISIIFMQYDMNIRFIKILSQQFD